MNQDEAYLEAIRVYGAAVARLAGGYERDRIGRDDLLQDIHIALWRSLTSFDGRCALRTWVYRVAHNVAIKYVLANRRTSLSEWRTLEELSDLPDQRDDAFTVEHEDALRHVYELIGRLKPTDRQVILLYLEELGADEIGEIVGLSPQNVATKIHRIKGLLASRFRRRGRL